MCSSKHWNTYRDDENLMKLRRTRLFQVCFLALFIVILLLSVVFSWVLQLAHISLILLIVDIIVAVIVAVFGSLSIREEEEELS